MSTPMRRNIAHLTDAERQQFVDAVRQIDLLAYGDGVSYWDKQDQIHQGTHNHGGNSFIPWHRELCNRFEKLLQQVDPGVALHYWDWTTDPRNSPDGNAGTVNLCTDLLMGTASGVVAGTLAPLHNGDVMAGSRDATGDPADPPQAIRRNIGLGAPGLASDANLIQSADALPQAQQWSTFRMQVEGAHDSAHGYFGPGSNIAFAHSAFEDPFVFLLHSNVDRLFAMWQAQQGEDWRLDPDLVYGDQSNTNDPHGILHNLQPWDGTVEFGAPIPPWTGASSEIVVKNSRDPSVVRPPCYDTLPINIAQVAPDPGDPIRFLDVYEDEQTARAFRLRVSSCRQVTCNASLTGNPRFSLLSSTVLSPEPVGFEIKDVLVWVLFDPGQANSSASATLDVTVAETGDTFTVPIDANVIEKPTVATSVVLDRSGSMDLPSGVAAATRIDILRSAAPLFVHLLDDDDGIGLVRFDTDADPAVPVQVAGGQIAGVGRTAALNGITTHTTNPFGLTAIGDGVEAASVQLAAAPAFDSPATVVFTDGHETASKYISDVASLVNGRVFAIGLGTADQLDPGSLNDLVDGTGGYLLLTGNAGPDDQILLQKYFAQVLAGVTNSVIIVDPEGFVQPGGQAVVPYDLTATETRTDVIVLSPAAEILVVTLEAPDGTLIDALTGAQLVEHDSYQTLRLRLAPPAVPGQIAGRWRVQLEVDTTRLNDWLRKLESNRQSAALGRIRTHGVPFNVIVEARSSLRLGINIHQPSRVPGTSAIISATLTESGIPLGYSSRVQAMVTAPDGEITTLRLQEIDAGRYQTDVRTPESGVYRVRVRAEGTSLRGQAFTREELRTLSVWVRGDARLRPADKQGLVDWGRLVSCFLEDGTFGKLAREHGADIDYLRRCVAEACSTAVPASKTKPGRRTRR